MGSAEEIGGEDDHHVATNGSASNNIASDNQSQPPPPAYYYRQWHRTPFALIQTVQVIIYTLIVSVRFWVDILHYTLLVAVIDGAKFFYTLANPWSREDSLNSINVAVDTTPTFFRAFWKHMLLRSTGRIKAGQSLSYAEGMELVKEFLQFASKHTVEELQSFTGKETPVPSWVNRQVVEIPTDSLDAAAEILQKHLEQDDPCLKFVGGKNWWRLRCRPLYGEWVEMKRDAEKRELCRRTGQTLPPERYILYLHGGAHYFAGNGTHRYQIQRHARKLAARAFSVSFRLAPQYPFPCSLLDALAAYLYLIGPPEGSEAPAIHPHQIMLYGDSSGGGLALALLILLRDSNLPLPAGTVLLSPWVDLTHSFPSVMGDPSGDYIPAEGFHFKPSLAWPPIREAPLVFKKGRKKLVINEQIQLYCSNQLIGHPLVSLVNQGSLGGLPPMLIVGGSAELLADEIMYIAHKAANPEKYPPSQATLERYPNQRDKVKQYPPTLVHLQMFDDCCHVATTLSFSTPAKFQYRSCASFALWALKAAEVAAERDNEEELHEISKDQHHFDYATNTKADAPPQHSSPPKYRFNPRGNRAKQRSQDDTLDQDKSGGHAQADSGHHEDDDEDIDEAGEELRKFPLYKANGRGIYGKDISYGSNKVTIASVNGEAITMERETFSDRRRRRRSSIKEQLEKFQDEEAHNITEEDAIEASKENEDLSDYTEDSESEDEPEEDRAEAERIIRSRGNSSTSMDFRRGPDGHLEDAHPAASASNSANTTFNGTEEAQEPIEQELISVTGQEPPFKNHIVRQRVTPDGFARAMEPESQLTALQMDRECIGQISPDGPVWRWLEKKKIWDRAYRRDLIYYRKIRMKDRKKADQVGHLSRTLFDENPPLSSVAGMYDEKLAWQSVRDQDGSVGNDGRTERAGLSMLLWSKLSSKPDAEQQGRKTIDEMARKGDAKLKRRPSSIATPEIEKEIEEFLE